LSEDKVKQCVDPKLNNDYPPKAVAKVHRKNFSRMGYLFSGMHCQICYRDSTDVFLIFQLAAVAALCVQYESDFRPNMTIVVKAIQPLLNAPKPAAPAAPQS
jgi:hypothetical protein